ncbi:coiled-coil domain-containing protein 57 isoform X1 [Apteryx rowi]|uniref:coiled-coil domain-containing protein 57 isoform X1 n=1 Tax=Apteryx rowi TaxID=308060 RepID=UPI000E1C5196|nr:coiled-coil domain-containing protein 57 isoform X1 [Apteryx rowi]XP_025926919.1 coiled-coil domain-containing protein 57 isoform X1 [Apteryx rowi]
MEKELNELTKWNEKEWKELQACKFSSQKTTLQDVSKQLQDMHEKFNKLKEDFVYNLRILEERDKELERYDVMVTHLKTSENAKKAEISDLRIQLDKLEQALMKERKKRELHYHCQQNLEDHKLELKQFCSSKNSNIGHQCEDYVSLKHVMEGKLQELEGELASQKQELLAEFDAEMKRREREFQQQTNKMGDLVLSHEVKVKLLTKELEVLKEAGMKAAESLQRAETINLKLEKEIKFKDWEFKDFVAVKDARHEVLDHAAKEKTAMPASVKEAQAEQLQNLEKQIRELQMRHKILEMELHRRERSHSACLREKDALIGKLQEELVTLKTCWDSHLIEISKQFASKDFQIQSMHEEEKLLRVQLTKFQEDTEWCKQQLAPAAEGEQILEQSKAQEELDWRQHCEKAERNQYQKSEDLMQSLSSASEQVEADLQKTEYRLHEMETVLSAFSEREQTIQALWSHDILPEGEKQIFLYDDKSSLNKDFPPLEVQKLQKQNDDLRATIAQMRKEMESLDEQMLPSCPLTENRQLAEQTNTDITTEISALTPGSSCTDKVSTRTTLNNIKVSSTNLDLIVKPHKEKGPKNKVLQEKMVDHGQQLSDIGPSDGLPYGVGCSLQGIQNKLKEAVRKILILSQEKQQLIEMGNRLRAELGMVSKEGLRHPASSKCCMVCVASGSLFPRELVRRAQCQLSALEHLQYKLATQVQLDSSTENCGAAQQKACTSSELVDSQPLRESPNQAQQVWLSSSRTHRSCQDIWHALEMGSNPSILSPQNNAGQGVEFEVIRTTEMPEESQQNIKAKDKAEMPATHLTVTGTKLEVQQKLKSRNLSCAHPIKPKTSSNVAKIRNYNLKD